MKNEQPEIIVKHDNVEIGYYESDNTWKFVLRGRNRSAESLTKAKEAIDKPVDPKEQPFNRFEAILFNSWHEDDIKKVTVTSIAERSRNSSYSDTVWIVDKEGTRSKEGAHALVAITDANMEKLKRRNAINKEIAVLDKEKKALDKSLTRVTLPKDAEEKV